MSWDVQMVVAAGIVGLAAAYVVRATWKMWAGKKAGCGSGCGKCSTPAAPPQNGLMSLPQV